MGVIVLPFFFLPSCSPRVMAVTRMRNHSSTGSPTWNTPDSRKSTTLSAIPMAACIPDFTDSVATVTASICS